MFDILVVDDDKNIRFLMRELLESEHYNVPPFFRLKIYKTIQ